MSSSVRFSFAAALVFAASGITFAMASGGSQTLDIQEQTKITPVRYTSASLEPDVRVHETPSEILARIIGRYGGNAIIQASFGDPLPGWTGTEDPASPMAPSLRDGRWFYATVRSEATDHQLVRPIWEANLVAAALRDELHRAGVAGELIASNVSVELPDGDVLENIGGGMGNVAFEQRFATRSDSEIRAEIEDAAITLGLDLRGVRVLHPLQPAPAVTVAVSDPATFVPNAEAAFRHLFGGTATYEGQYLEAVDLNGDPVLIQATSFRSGVGQLWIRPEFDRRSQARSSLGRLRR